MSRKVERKSVPCKFCQKEINVRITDIRTKYCSKKCSGLDRIQMCKDSPELRYKLGTANRGKIFSEERRENMKKGKVGISGTPHTEESKVLIGKKSKEKFTKEYKETHRKKMEESGHWIPLSKMSESKIYHKESNWIGRMFDYITEPIQLEKLDTLKVFNCRTNRKGVVRDHMYSRRSGFENNVSPILLRHPCNCQILTHAENVKKKSSRYIDLDHHTLAELVEKIKNYNGKEWKEHSAALQIIKEKYNE